MRNNFYTYCLLKYKHSPFLDESVNIGVLIYFGNSQSFSFKYSKNLSRIKSIYDNIPEKTIKEYLRQIHNRLEKLQSFNENLFPLNDLNLKDFLHQNILPIDASVLQFSNFKTDYQDIEQSILEDIIFEQYFIEDIKTSNYQTQEPKIISHFYSVLNKNGFREVVNKNRIQKDFTLKTETGNFNFDFAWKNGVWNLVKPVGFDLKTPEGIIQKARNNLGEFTDLESEVKSQYKCAIIVGKPTDKKLFGNYTKALSILHKLPDSIEVLEENDLKNYSLKVIEAVSKQNVDK
ncbi:hypothetical protein DM790_25770 [Flavobacterium collinsii]|nr:hypothetical protein [Flavobacterium collinsii]